MSVLVTADLHFTDHPRDMHRWELLPWLAKMADRHGAEAVLLLGDLTDAKDKHSSVLTNTMARGLRALSEAAPVYIIRGNHDYIEESEPFFGFIDEMGRDTGGRIRFMTGPTPVTFKGVGKVLFLPYSRDPDLSQVWKDMDWGFSGAAYVFTHHTFDGCLTENGTRLDGIPPSVFAKFKGKVISGDIHKPQKVGKNIEYVGAPYRCRFGDDYKPRVLLINDDGTTKDLRFPTKNKILIKLFNNTLQEAVVQYNALGFDPVYEGDQIKVRVELPRAQYGEWPAIRQRVVEEAAGLGLELTGPELVALPDQPKASPAGQKRGQQPQTGPAAAVAAYAAQKGAGEALKTAGLALLKQAQGGKS